MIMVPGDRVSSRDSDVPRARHRRRRRSRDAGRRRRSAPLHDARDEFETRVHPARAGGAAGQHFAHRRGARRRAQQPVPEDARLRHRAVARGEDEELRGTPDLSSCSRHSDAGARRRCCRAGAEHRAAWRRSSPAGPCRLRPHFKAHKTPEIARRQLAAGSCAGLTCATVRRRRWSADLCDDLLIANEIVGPGQVRARRGARARRVAMTVAVDSVAGLEAHWRRRRGRRA